MVWRNNSKKVLFADAALAPFYIGGSFQNGRAAYRLRELKTT